MSRHGAVVIAVVAALLVASAVRPASGAADLLPPQIHSVAGGGSCTMTAFSYTGQLITVPCNNVSPTSVPIAQARSVAALSGNAFLYVDEGNQVVQEVAGGTVTTVAGGGSSCGYFNGTSCDGAPATSVSLDDPVGVAALPDGGFLITEYAGARVLIVGPGPPGFATITTLAGTGTNADSTASGPATSFPLNFPTDAEPTASGGVLIANSGSNDIRYVAGDGTISTVAGGGTCNDATTSCDGMTAGQVALDQPASVSPIQGGSGGFLIAEYGDGAVRAVSQVSSSGTFTTVAGLPGQIGYAGDGGPASAALLDQPEQVLSTPDGGFLIADAGNEVIRQVSPTGTITTVAGTPPGVTFGGDGGAATAASFNAPVAISRLANGNLLIADENNDRIREVTIPSVSTISLSPSSPTGANGWYTSSVTATVKATESAKLNCILDPPAAPPAFGAIPTGCPFTGSGASISGNGVHTLYSASMNSFGDQELPIDAVVKIDTSPPMMACSSHPSFLAGTRGGKVTATVTDPDSGPAAPVVSARANTSRLGVHHATLAGMNNAGFLLDLFCSYTVLPRAFKPLPAMSWAFAHAGGGTSVRRLVVKDVAAQAEVVLTCRGTGCPFSSARNVTGAVCGAKPCTATSKQRRRRRDVVDLTRLFVGARLAPGARLVVSVSKALTIGREWQFTIKTDGNPSHRVSCLDPNGAATKGCVAAR